MAIADVITAGFGTFSTVNEIPTRGFGARITPLYAGIEIRLAHTSPEYRVASTSPEYRVKNTSPEYQVAEV